MTKSTFASYRRSIYADLYRRTGHASPAHLVKHLVYGGPFKYNFWLRTSAYSARAPFLRLVLYPIARFRLRRLTFKLGILIPYRTSIDDGLYIVHAGNIVVNGKTVIGRNCTLCHGVTLGEAARGKRKGCPTIGDNVYLGPGAKVFGAVTIGNNVAVGANCVVTTDIPDNSVVVGVPGRVISNHGASAYVTRTDYGEL